MANIKTLSKVALGTLAAGAMLTATATPAAAQSRGDRYDRNRDGISAGEIIAGAVVLGGLAAILSSGDNDRYNERTYGDNGYGYGYGYDYNRYGNSRQAVNQCVSAVQQRYGYRNGGVRVDQITRIDRNSKGYKIAGRISVNDRGGYGYGNGYGNRNDRRGYNGGYNNGYYGDRYNGRGYDTGSFDCTIKYGRIDKLKVRGI